MTRPVLLVLFTVTLIAPGNGGAQTGTGLLRGRIIDSVGAPLSGAEISLPALSMRTAGNDSGHFQIDRIPAGKHEVIVRHLGYSPEVFHLTFAETDTIDRQVALRRVQRLETVEVQAANLIPSFEEHRRLGLGTFITRAELAPQEGRKLSEVIAQIRGIRLHHSLSARTYVYSSRRPVTSIRPRLMGDGTEGAPRGACYAQVYLDAMIVFRGSEGETLFDINAIPPSSIEAIEYYAGPATTPPKYSKLNSQCGVLVIHTRRSP